MNGLASIPVPGGEAGPHAAFLALYPVIERHAQRAFRGAGPDRAKDEVAVDGGA
jgi:hypothetical protein